MIRHTYTLFISITMALSFYSCGTLRFPKSEGFITLKSGSEIDGEYKNRTFYVYDRKNNPSNWNNYSTILGQLNIAEASKFETVSLLVESPNKLKVSYKNDSIEQVKYFEGKMKKKYFEIYFSKDQIIIPIIFTSVDVDRVRIGKNKDGSLNICHLVDQSGNLLFLAGGSGSDNRFSFIDVNQLRQTEITPEEFNGKWGYVDTYGNIQIEPIYDFTCFFEKDAARVKLNNKWGLIDKTGNKIIPIEYDYINPIDTLHKPAIFKVAKEGKHGVLNTSGEELIPVIYDQIDNRFSGMYTTIRFQGKFGIITRDKVIIPAIYSDIKPFFISDYREAKRDNHTYLVDKEGYEYEIKTKQTFKDVAASFLGGDPIIPDKNTKRKISFDEQFNNTNEK